MANAYGLSSGAYGQVLTALSEARETALAEIARQRILLGKDYQAAINEAEKHYNAELIWKLYQDALAEEEALKEDERYITNLFYQFEQGVMGK